MDVIGDPVRLVVVVESDVLRRASGGERNVRAVLLSVQAVVHVPRAVERHLVFVRAGRRYAEGVPPDVAVRVEGELGDRAGRIPVPAASDFGLVVARYAHRGRYGLRRRLEGAQAQDEYERQHKGANALVGR